MNFEAVPSNSIVISIPQLLMNNAADGTTKIDYEALDGIDCVAVHSWPVASRRFDSAST